MRNLDENSITEYVQPERAAVQKKDRDMAEISDGLEALRSVMSLREIALLIERTARWVSPETFKLLPLWFPEHGRRSPFYKANWSEPK